MTAAQDVSNSSLSDSPRTVLGTTPLKPYKYNGSPFKTASSYLDVARTAPVRTHHTLPKGAVNALPLNTDDSNRVTKTYETMYAPFSEGVTPFWQAGIRRSALNHQYGPFGAMFYTMRDHHGDFYSRVNNATIPNEREFNKLRDTFNDLWTRILDGYGDAPERGLCSVDEMIALGNMFFLLLKSSDIHRGLILDNDLRFANEFNGDAVSINMPIRKARQYSAKLENSVFSDLGWKHFMNLYLDDTDTNTLWYLRLPDLFDGSQEMLSQTGDGFDVFDESYFVECIDFVESVTDRGGDFMAATIDPEDHDVTEDICKMFSLFEKEPRHYKKGDLHMYEKVQLSGHGASSYYLFTNYPMNL